MKKLALLAMLLYSCAALAIPPALTVVTVTLTDSSSQVWTAARWQTNFVPPFGNPSRPNNNGNPITPNQAGIADGTGTFTVTLDDNTVVAPSGSKWQFVICPNASVSSCNTINISVHGATQNLSTIISAILTVPSVSSAPTLARAYNDTEVNGGFGALYVNTTDNTIRQCTLAICQGAGWISLTISTNNPIFTGTLTTNCVKFVGNASNDATVCPQLTGGHIALTLPNTAGTIPSTATSPIVLNSTTGNISCPTCSTGGTSFPLLAPDSAFNIPQYAFSAATGTGLARDTTSGDLTVGIDGFGSGPILSFNGAGQYISQGKFFCWTSGSSTGHTCNGELDVSTASPLTIYTWKDLTAQTFNSNFVLGRVDTNNSTYAISGFENSTPVSSPGVAHQWGYFKAGKGFCAKDNGGVEYCTSTGGGGGIVAQASTTTIAASPVGNSNTTVMSISMFAPSSGCPCRAVAYWTLYLSVSNSGQDVAYVHDNQGNAGFAGAETATTGAATGYGLTGSGYVDGTYANSTLVNFSLIMAGSHAGSTTINSTQQGTAITGAPLSTLKILMYPSI